MSFQFHLSIKNMSRSENSTQLHSYNINGMSQTPDINGITQGFTNILVKGRIPNISDGIKRGISPCRSLGFKWVLQIKLPKTTWKEVTCVLPQSHRIHAWYVCVHSVDSVVNMGKYLIHGSYEYILTDHFVWELRITNSLFLWLI